MDNMLGENKNLKDTTQDPVKDVSSTGVSLVQPFGIYSKNYNRANKLITALYMVTDIMQKDEPIRVKLRTLGTDILSDIISVSKRTPNNLEEKITMILSFLDIAFNVGMISEMNSNILKKEFTELKQAVQEYTKQNNFWLEEFIGKEDVLDKGSTETKGLAFSSASGRMEKVSPFGNRIGVQKGGTLLKAIHNISEKKEHFEITKRQRRESIIKVIKDKPDGMNIKDINIALESIGQKYGTKTLQRELVSMVAEDILKKSGEKRWSKYSL